MAIDKENGELIALSLLTLGESMHSFSSFLPSRFTVRTWVLDGNEGEIEKKIDDLRSGYPPAVVISLGLGAVISYIAKSPLPVLFAAGSSAAMIALYEQGLPSERRMKLCDVPSVLLNGGCKSRLDEVKVNLSSNVKADVINLEPDQWHRIF